MRLILVLILQCAMLFVAIRPAEGQYSRKISRRAEKMYKKATDAYQSIELQTCLALSSDLVQNYPFYSKAWLLLGQCSDELGNKKQALEAYNKFFELDSLLLPDVALRITELHLLRGMYHDASTSLEAFERISKNPSSSSRKKVLHLEEQLTFAIRQINKYTGEPVIQGVDSINTINEEYFPSLTVDGRMLIFTRQEVDTSGNDLGFSQEDLFRASLGPGHIIKVTKLPPPLNTNNNEGTQTIRQDGRLMLFTACNRSDSKGGCDIYSSRKTQNAWSAPMNLGYPVNTRYWESTPSLGPDGRTLYFASNRPGGYGGMDIWLSHFDPREGWEEPINLGPTINTDKNEMSPFLHGDGRSLYFSSSGWIGMGGLDLFLSRQNDSMLWT
ncbi:MAG: PD40 domain-containing protein, partial [Bacteroidales bacterium]|nr:PD40 domain-containing protein [Bacteroidales bacterium]